MLDRIRIILIHTTHPGNIGAVARAMKNMGLSELCLVAPKEFPSQKADMMASSAIDILEQASVKATFEEAVMNCHWVVGFSGRERRIPTNTFELRAGMSKVIEHLEENPGFKVALVFGQEKSGLSNEELEKCHYQIVIPTNPVYTALNLAQAVQLATYEIRMAMLGTNLPLCTVVSKEEQPATFKEIEGFYTHLETILEKIHFLRPDQSPYLMVRLRRLFGRVGLDKMELNILRGILTAIQKSI